jgi:hypothetical protein
MTQTDFVWDDTARKHGGHPNSVAANRRIHPFKESDKEAIRIQVSAAGFSGLTSKEIRIEHPTEIPRRFKYPNEFSGRITALKAEGKIHESGRKRDGADVLVADRRWINGSVTK